MRHPKAMTEKMRRRMEERFSRAGAALLHMQQQKGKATSEFLAARAALQDLLRGTSPGQSRRR